MHYAIVMPLASLSLWMREPPNFHSWRCDDHEDGLEPLVLVLAPLQLSHEGGNDNVRHELGLVIDLNLPIDPEHSRQRVSESNRLDVWVKE